jgi:hypothetical protein
MARVDLDAVGRKVRDWLLRHPGGKPGQMAEEQKGEYGKHAEAMRSCSAASWPATPTIPRSCLIFRHTLTWTGRVICQVDAVQRLRFDASRTSGERSVSSRLPSTFRPNVIRLRRFSLNTSTGWQGYAHAPESRAGTGHSCLELTAYQVTRK